MSQKLYYATKFVNFEFQHNDITLCLKVFILVYADDTVEFGMVKEYFQNDLDMLFDYLELWHLTIN